MDYFSAFSLRSLYVKDRFTTSNKELNKLISIWTIFSSILTVLTTVVMLAHILLSAVDVAILDMLQLTPSSGVELRTGYTRKSD